MWIKICGCTNLEDALLAVEGGADALGFVFAPSPRQVTTTQARHITAELPAQIERYGVFVNAPFSQIAATVSECGLSGVQLHRATDPDLPSRLREHFAGRMPRLSIVQAVNISAQSTQSTQSTDWIPDQGIDAVLVDSSSAMAAGGTGISFDWAGARESLLRMAAHSRVIVAGGLRPENVRRAISILRPWGVDVVSGVEAAPGKKDPARLLAFIREARQAEADLSVLPAEARASSSRS
jgi:phosphoribosylanthranilate isomerase